MCHLGVIPMQLVIAVYDRSCPYSRYNGQAEALSAYSRMPRVYPVSRCRSLHCGKCEASALDRGNPMASSLRTSDGTAQCLNTWQLAQRPRGKAERQARRRVVPVFVSPCRRTQRCAVCGFSSASALLKMPPSSARRCS